MFRSTKLAIILGLIAFIIALINALTARYVSGANSVLTQGHFKSIQQGQSRLGVWYKIHIAENDSAYYIPEDNANCFSYSYFKKDVKIGQPIKIYKCKTSYLTNPTVVSIITGGMEYMSRDRINEKLDNKRFSVPLFVGGFVTLIILAIASIIKKLKKFTAGSKSYQ